MVVLWWMWYSIANVCPSGTDSNYNSFSIGMNYTNISNLSSLQLFFVEVSRDNQYVYIVTEAVISSQERIFVAWYNSSGSLIWNTGLTIDVSESILDLSDDFLIIVTYYTSTAHFIKINN